MPPLARTEGTLNEYALGEPMCGCPSRLKRIRSIALASVAVPTVERGSGPIRSWSTGIAVANAVRLLDRLLDDLGAAGLQPLEGAVEVGGGQGDDRVGALGHHLQDGAALVVGDAGVGGRRVQDDRRVGLVGGADRDPAHP